MSRLENVARGLWEVHHDKNKTNMSVWGWERQTHFQPIKWPFLLSSSQPSCLLRHIKRQKVFSTRGWRVTFLLAISCFFPHSTNYVISPPSLLACHPPPLPLLPPSSAPLLQIFHPWVIPGITLDWCYVICLSIFSEEWRETGLLHQSASSHWT